MKSRLKSRLKARPLPGRLIAVFALSLAAIMAKSDDKILFESLKLNGTPIRNVRVSEVTPTQVTIHYDGGAARIKRQDLPSELKALYPYDAKEAAAYEKQLKTAQEQRANEARARQDQIHRELKASLQLKEQTVQAKLSELQRELDKLEREMGPARAKARGKKNSPARKELDAMRDSKQALIKRLEEQKDLLAKVRKQLQPLP